MMMWVSPESSSSTHLGVSVLSFLFVLQQGECQSASSCGGGEMNVTLHGRCVVHLHASATLRVLLSKASFVLCEKGV